MSLHDNDTHICLEVWKQDEFVQRHVVVVVILLLTAEERNKLFVTLHIIIDINDFLALLCPLFIIHSLEPKHSKLFHELVSASVDVFRLFIDILSHGYAIILFHLANTHNNVLIHVRVQEEDSVVCSQHCVFSKDPHNLVQETQQKIINQSAYDDTNEQHPRIVRQWIRSIKEITQ